MPCREATALKYGVDLAAQRARRVQAQKRYQAKVSADPAAAARQRASRAAIAKRQHAARKDDPAYRAMKAESARKWREKKALEAMLG